MKRFYKDVATAGDGTGYRIELDGRPVRTPLKKLLAVSSPVLAEAIAGEWRDQGDEINPRGMPMMQLAATALDRIGAERDAIAGQIAGYGGTDLVCYRADFPDDLVEQQAAAWDPLIDWLDETCGARLVPTAGIKAVDQSPDALASIRTAVDECDDFTLAALSVATAHAGSVVIGLAFVRGHLDAEQAFLASRVDEEFQIARWGLDHEAETRRDAVRTELLNAGRFLELYRQA